MQRWASHPQLSVATVTQTVKESTCNVGHPGWIPGLGRPPGEGNGNPLQYSCLENSLDRGAWQATVHGIAKSRIWLSDSHFPTFTRINIGTGCVCPQAECVIICFFWLDPWVQVHGLLFLTTIIQECPLLSFLYKRWTPPEADLPLASCLVNVPSLCIQWMDGYLNLILWGCGTRSLRAPCVKLRKCFSLGLRAWRCQFPGADSGLVSRADQESL